MAVRPQHMHDGGIAERRLRPIYDWLDNGNNKKALQEAEKVLKKSPTLQAARALKALALLRLGKNVEAHAVLDALADEKPSDDTTLQAMTISYRESQQLHKVCALYEAAVKVDGTSEELHSHLFMSYVRIGDYKAQQRAAMALYKFSPKNPYYFWAVMSIVLQAKESEDATKRGILLTLAQRMVDNFITDNKLEAEQEARLYIMILELQEKWDDILKFLESPLYSQLVPGATPQAYIPYLKKLNQWRKLNLLCKDLLIDNQDRWDYYMPYFDSVFHLMKDPTPPMDGEAFADDTAEKCHEFICLLVESMGSRTLRGPYLARLELYKRLAVDGDPKALLGSGVALCVQYLRLFAHKPCALPDLKPFLAMIPQNEREEQCRDFLTCLGMDEDSLPESSDDIQRHVSCLAAWRVCSPVPAPDASLAVAARLKKHYLRCLSEGRVTSTITEFCAADMYGLLAAHHYFYAAVQQESSQPLLEALCLLELVLSKSPANFHAKLLITKLYHVLGSALSAEVHFQRTEVKHVQHVSLWWWHGARLAAAAAHAAALHHVADLRAFHANAEKDSVEHLTYAYKYGTFEKLSELCAWRGRLARCLVRRAAAADAALLAAAAAPRPAALPAAPVHHLTDNRDLDVIVNWEPPECRDPNLRAKTFEQDIAHVTLRERLVACLTLATDLSECQTDKEKLVEKLLLAVDGLRSDIDKYKETYSAREKISISAPFPSRIIGFVNSPVPYRELYSTAFNIIADLSCNKSRDAQDGCGRIVRLVESSVDTLNREIARRLENDAGWNMREALEELSNYLEFIGIVTHIISVCNELVTPNMKKTKKKNANRSTDEIKTTEILNKFNEAVQCSIANLEKIFENLPQYQLDGSFQDEVVKLATLSDYVCPVEQRLCNAKSDMIKDVSNILKWKCKILKGLVQN